MSHRVVILGSGSKGNSLLVASSNGAATACRGPTTTHSKQQRQTARTGTPSTSSGQASPVPTTSNDNGGVRLLVDLGFSQRQIAADLAAHGVGHVDALLVTHTHSDHVRDASLKFCWYNRVPLVTAEENLAALRLQFHTMMSRLEKEGLVRPLPARGLTIKGVEVRSFEVPHDARGVTLGFRLTLPNGGTEPLQVVVATDLGHVPPEVARELAKADILVLESNHDPALLEASGRPPELIDRIAGDLGHLSNGQAAATVAQLLEHLPPGKLAHVVLAHLSQECNDPRLALREMKRVLAPLGSAAPQLSAASQSEHLAISLNKTPDYIGG